MRIIRIAIVAGVAALVLQHGGLAQRASTVLQDLQQQVEQLARNGVGTAGHGDPATGDFRDADVHIRSATNTSSPVVGVGNPGDGVRINGPLQGETVLCPDGTSTPEWLRVLDRRTQVDGFVSRCFL